MFNHKSWIFSGNNGQTIEFGGYFQRVFLQFSSNTPKSLEDLNKGATASTHTISELWGFNRK